jgi:hypothetical protein
MNIKTLQTKQAACEINVTEFEEKAMTAFENGNKELAAKMMASAEENRKAVSYFGSLINKALEA